MRPNSKPLRFLQSSTDQSTVKQYQSKLLSAREANEVSRQSVVQLWFAVE
jgi:hypothetical protein